MPKKPTKTEQPPWVKKIDLRISELINEARDERKQWSDDVEEAFGFYNCDRSVIFQSPLDSEARRDPDAESQYHIPVVRQHVDGLVASTTGNDIKIRYVPYLDQSTLNTMPDDVARMGNALFGSYRSHIGWDNKIHKLSLHTALFGRGYMSLYVDEVQNFPDPRADIRLLNAWQVYSTPGVPFEQATEVATECWIDKEELKAQYPELADEIDGVTTAGEAEKRTDGMGGDTSPTNRIPWDNLLPGYGDQNAVVSKNSVLVRERFKFDPTYLRYSHEQSEKEMEQEHAMLRMAIDAEDPSLIPPVEMVWNDAQYHDDHSIGHLMFVAQLRQEMGKTEVKGLDPYTGVRTEGLIWGMGKQAVAEQAIQRLLEHEQLHADASEGLEEWEVGTYPKYDGGWRQTIILGKGADAVGVYDGYSKWMDYGIQGVPMVEFNVAPSPLEFWTNSFACLLVDENKLMNSFMNGANNNHAIFGNNTWWTEDGIQNQPGFHISADPRVPSTFPPGTFPNQPGGKAGIVPAPGIPPDSFNMMQFILMLAQQTSGIFGSIRGQRQEGVRSASHEQFLAGQNRMQLDTYQRLWKNSLERLCIMLFKLMLAIPPDDNFVKPMLDGKAVPVDMKLLDKIEFTIEVIMAPGGSSSTEERQSMLLGIVQNISQHPLIAQNPKGLILMLKLFADALKLDQPLFYEAMTKYLGELEQQAEAMMQQQQAQMAMQQTAQPPQGPPKG